VESNFSVKFASYTQEQVAGLKVGASGAFENAFEVSQRQKQLEKLQLPMQNRDAFTLLPQTQLG